MIQDDSVKRFSDKLLKFNDRVFLVLQEEEKYDEFDLPAEEADYSSDDDDDCFKNYLDVVLRECETRADAAQLTNKAILSRLASYLTYIHFKEVKA